MDGQAAIWEGFQSEFYRLLGSYDDKSAYDYVERLSPQEAEAAGRQAARSVFAPFIWGRKVGDRWDIRHSCEFLGVSRQALYKRVRTGSALGIPGQGTTYFPTWQFDLDKRLIRQVVGEVICAFREADDEVNPLVIAAWATSNNQLLDGLSPAEWIEQEDDHAPVVSAARRAAAGLAA